MYHSITFSQIGSDPWVMQTGKNTWDDWHLVPSSRPLFDPPSVKEHIVDIPGKDGVLDFTESLTGFPIYNRREGSIEFIVMNGYQEWYELYSAISIFLHGKVLRAVLEDDPDYYYEGRFTVNSWKSEKDYSRITIGYKVSPFKWRVSPSNQTVTVTESNYQRQIAYSYTSTIGEAVVYPTITISGGTVEVNYDVTDESGRHTEKTITLSDGTYALVDCLIQRNLPVRALIIRWVSGTSVTVNSKLRKGEL